MTLVQSIILKKEYFKNRSSGIDWIRKHGYKAEKIDETDDYYRFRQFDPDLVADYRIRTVPLGSLGFMIVAYK